MTASTTSKGSKEGDYRITRTWNFERADYNYKLQEFRKEYNFFGTVTDDNLDWRFIASSEDIAWAERTAKHFAIAIEDAA